MLAQSSIPYWYTQQQIIGFALFRSVPLFYRNILHLYTETNHPLVLYIYVEYAAYNSCMRWFGIYVFLQLSQKGCTLYTQQCALTRFRNEGEQCIKKAFLLCNTQMKRSNITDTGDVKFAHKL